MNIALATYLPKSVTIALNFSLDPKITNQAMFECRLRCTKQYIPRQFKHCRFVRYEKVSFKKLSNQEEMNRYGRLTKRSQDNGVILFDSATGTEIKRWECRVLPTPYFS